ncbi:hypothetical protein ACN38_g8986 [Penicillium nordicum]|uniref:Uncharacterized protein n=1 Tax=Penicillium nordicum TaxID=229535 RepID=A0A0M8P4E0_9EURO|nr:hypothetical protein ACN38_g8986 [Penicillium nordicum]
MEYPNPTPTEGPGTSRPAEHPQPTKPAEDSKEYHDPNASHIRALRFKDGSRPHRKRTHRRHRSRTRDRESSSSKRRHGEEKKPEFPDPTGGYPFRSNRDAFRESLFDAMGDDEGAAYWESVYGQPIHNYRVPDVQREPEGELEGMTEEEYVDYVRRRMWERTREGMLAEQERLRAERQQRRKEETRRNTQFEREAFERAMDESLRRGAERKKAKDVWGTPWAEYLESWETIGKAAEESTTKSLRNLIFWPVRSGKRVDVRPTAVEEFMRHAPAPAELMGTLKTERIRWHPDKIQHRYGALGIDDVVMRSVTEVFQIVDRLWNEERERQK